MDITLFQISQALGIIGTIIGVGIGISKRMANERAKYCTREYLNQTMKTMNVRFESIEREIIDNKRENEKNHDTIKEDYIRGIENLDKKLDLILSFIKK